MIFKKIFLISKETRRLQVSSQCAAIFFLFFSKSINDRKTQGIKEGEISSDKEGEKGSPDDKKTAQKLDREMQLTIIQSMCKSRIADDIATDKLKEKNAEQSRQAEQGKQTGQKPARKKTNGKAPRGK